MIFRVPAIALAGLSQTYVFKKKETTCPAVRSCPQPNVKACWRTLFILDWPQSVELRRRVHAGLNKGEARNALARAMFFNRLGEIRGRSFEQQRYRASGLNLVTAAIVL